MFKLSNDLSLRIAFDLDETLGVPQVYVNKVLSYGLDQYFQETYSWDELPCRWKDIRTIKADCLIDDSPNHQECAKTYLLEQQYCVIHAYGSTTDNNNGRLWVEQIYNYLHGLIK
jgi:hypothetical protein